MNTVYTYQLLYDCCIAGLYNAIPHITSNSHRDVERGVVML